jgi:hypothetical protein
MTYFYTLQYKEITSSLNALIKDMYVGVRFEIKFSN